MIIAEQLNIFCQNCRDGFSVASKRHDLSQFTRAKKYNINIICHHDVNMHANDNLGSFIKAE